MRTRVLITGASSGIGEAFARRLAPEHDLVLVARRGDRLQQIAAELKAQHGAEVEPMAADLTGSRDLDRVADLVASDARLALLVNNAGFGTLGRFWESDLAGQEQMHQLHVMATLRLTHAALRNMVARDFGAIVNVASVAAFLRGPGSASYSATKTWMTAMTEALYLELRDARSNVTIQALCPGFTYSEFHDRLGMQRQQIAPAPWWHTAEDVVDASIDGLRRRRLFVMPGWRYRLLTGIVTRLPLGLRLAFESYGGKRRQKSLPDAQASSPMVK